VAAVSIAILLVENDDRITHTHNHTCARTHKCTPPPKLSAHPPPVAHARMKTHPSLGRQRKKTKTNPGPNKRPLDDCKIQKHINQACCPIKGLPMWVGKDGLSIAEDARLIGGREPGGGVCARTCTHTQTHTLVRAHTHTHTTYSSTHTQSGTHKDTDTHTHTHMRAHTYTHIHTHTHTCTHACAHPT